MSGTVLDSDTDIATNPLLAGLRSGRTPAPCALVIFGASGDLTKRKLVPGLYALASEGSLPAGFTVIGAGRTEMSDAEFRASMRESIDRYGRVPLRPDVWQGFEAGLSYVTYDLGPDDGLAALREALEKADHGRGTSANRVYYCSVPPSAVVPLSERLRRDGLCDEPSGSFVRLIVEKPFGRNLETARELNRGIL